MYYITKSQWAKIVYKDRSIYNPNIRTVFEGCLIKGGGTTLLFEHEHFEIVDDNDERANITA